MRGRLLPVSLLILSATLALSGIAVLRANEYPSVKLPDGSRLLIEGLGPPGVSHLSGSAWQRLLYRALPGGLKTRSGARELAAQKRARSPLLWTRHAVPNVTTSWYTVFAVGDGKGHELEVAGYPNLARTSGMFQPSHELWVYPRREPTLYLRIYARRGAEQSLVREVLLPNPAAGAYPVWKPAPLPAPRQAGGLRVVLEEFTWTAERGTPHGLLLREPRCRAVFQLTENAEPASDWAPIAAAVADATGNWSTPRQGIGRREKGRDALEFLVGGAWPTENAWKLDVELGRLRHFPTEHTWTARGVPLSRAGSWRWGERFVPVATGRTRTATLSVAAVHRDPPGNADSAAIRATHRVGVRVRSDEWDLRLRLLRAVDDRGRPVKVGSNPVALFQRWIYPSLQPRPAEMGGSFPLRVQPGTRSVDLTFAVEPSRFVSFTVAPPAGAMP
jgi:hypothetical protein